MAVVASRRNSMTKIPTINYVSVDDETPLLTADDRVVGMTWVEAMNEMKVLVRYAAPTICTMLLEYSFLITSVVSIGHLSTEKLAGAALGEITAGVTGLSIVQGFTSALESVLPQAWTSEHPSHVGLWTQRMLVLMGMLIMPVLAIWLNAEHIFLYLRQDPVVARYAALYLRYLVFLLPSFAFNRITRRYFQAQGLMHVPSVVVMIVTPINVGLNYFLVWGPEPFRLGFIGAPIATSISMLLVSSLYITYGVFFAPRTAWHPISSRAFTDLPKLFFLGLGGVGQSVASWWGWEFISLAASQFGPVTLAAQSILAVSASSAYLAHAGLGVASAIRVGNLLGAGDARGALIASRVAMALAVVQGLTLGSIFMSLHSRLACLFNGDPAVAKLVSSVVPLLAAYQVMDATYATTAGILRACGKITTGATASFFGYYVFGIPLGVFLAFSHQLGLFGLWVGIATALTFIAVSLYTIVSRLDWDIQVLNAKERIKTREEARGEETHA